MLNSDTFKCFKTTSLQHVPTECAVLVAMSCSSTAQRGSSRGAHRVPSKEYREPWPQASVNVTWLGIRVSADVLSWVRTGLEWALKSSMTGILTRWEDGTEQGTRRGRTSATRTQRQKPGMTQLPGRKPRGLPATARRTGQGQALPRTPRREHGSAGTWISDFQPPELRD